jgi:hypothetical protein
MKYALSIFCLSFIAVLSPDASARSITSFCQSESISALAEFMFDTGEDMSSSTRMTDKKINLDDTSKCAAVTSQEVLADVVTAMRKAMHFYPDEELPFEQALIDMEDYLDHQSYKKCTFIKKRDQSLVTISYYLNSDDKIHLRLDNITLTSE